MISRQDGWSGDEKADFPQVHLPWCGPGPADQLLDMCYEQMIHCTVPGRGSTWHLNHSLQQTQHSLLKCLRKTKKEVPPVEKPMVLKTHLRNRIMKWQKHGGWACTTTRPSTRCKSNQRWLATAWGSSPSHRSPLSMASLVLVPPTPPALSPIKKLCQ